VLTPFEFEKIETWIADHEDGPNDEFDQPYPAHRCDYQYEKP
jgi:hypothetical protein